MTQNDISIFETLIIQIHGLYDEVSALSKKNPDSPINKFKLKLVNQLLCSSNNILKPAYIPVSDFVVFDEDDLPSNSDVIMILSQYIKCLEKLRIDNIYYDSGYWYWIVDGKRSSITTRRPVDLR